jgi:hypothetical protein
MADFVKCTHGVGKDPIYVNFDTVRTIEANLAKGSTINFVGTTMTLEVYETPDQLTAWVSTKR